MTQRAKAVVEQLLEKEQATHQFKEGEHVAVVDLRTNTVVVPDTVIKRLYNAELPDGQVKPYADVEAGFGCSIRCLRRLKGY